jgi:hypothetical protein
MDTNPPTDAGNEPTPINVTPSSDAPVVDSTPAPVESAGTVEPPTPLVEPAPTVSPEPSTPSFFGGPIDAQPATAIPAPISTPSAGPVVSQPVVAPLSSSKKPKMGLFIGLGVIVVVLAGLATGYFVIKGNADKIADTYTTSTVSYLKQVYDAATSASGTPVDTQAAIAKLKKPTLPDAFLGTLSSKYTTAQTIQKKTATELATFNAQLTGFVSLYNFETAYSDLNTKAQTVADEEQSATTEQAYVSAVTDFLGLLTQLKTKVDATTPPSALSSPFKDLSSGYASLISDYNAALSALKSDDENAYNVASTEYSADYTNKVTPAKTIISTYYDSLSDKLTTVANTLNTYTDTVKD